jgi:hypothetical protein
MHPLLAKWLQKLKVNNISELDVNEKQTYDNYNMILSGGEITVDKILELCKAQKKIIENNYSNPDNSVDKDKVLKAGLGIYNTLIRLIEAPQSEKVALEQELNKLISQ